MKVCKRYEKADLKDFAFGEKLFGDISGIKNNVIITGGVGTGKTHLAYAILNRHATKKDIRGQLYYISEDVLYTSIKEVVDKIRNCWKTDADKFDFEEVDRFKNIPLLIVDEIGVQYGSASERIELFDIFNSRYNDELPTIALSNFKRQDIEKVLGLRITDRLFGSSNFIELTGKSRR